MIRALWAKHIYIFKQSCSNLPQHSRIQRRIPHMLVMYIQREYLHTFQCRISRPHSAVYYNRIYVVISFCCCVPLQTNSTHTHALMLARCQRKLLCWSVRKRISTMSHIPRLSLIFLNTHIYGNVNFDRSDTQTQ